MTQPALARPDRPPTGLDTLAGILAATRGTAPHGRDLWDLLHTSYPRAAATLASPSGALARHTQPRPELDRQQRAHLSHARRRHARDLIEDVGRALMTSPATLTALAARADRPIPPQARPALAAATRRRLTILGLVADELTVRRVTTATVEALRDALASMP